MRIVLPFGKKELAIEIEDHKLMAVLKPNEIKSKRTGREAVSWSLDHPIGTPRLEEICRPGERVVIVTSDITRPVPSALILPMILERLQQAGIEDRDITCVFALGSHRKHTQEEMINLVGKDFFARIKCIDSDPTECQYIGTSSHGTKYALTPDVIAADRVICVANIEFHYFAGYSGGAKSIMPGVADLACIQNNHRAMILPEASAGRLEGNPVRADIDEVAQFQRIDFIVNVVLDEQKQVLHAVSGHWKEAHRHGCAFLDRLYKIRIPQRADIVLVSAGGFPKDIDMYQAQKALDNAKHAVRDGGVIVWVGSCAEGPGNRLFAEWMLKYDPDEMIEEIARDFRLGAHKAAAIALVLKRSHVYIVSDVDPDLLARMGLVPQASLERAMTEAYKRMGPDARVLVMPYGGSTLPMVSSEGI